MEVIKEKKPRIKKEKKEKKEKVIKEKKPFKFEIKKGNFIVRFD